MFHRTYNRSRADFPNEKMNNNDNDDDNDDGDMNAVGHNKI